MDDDTRQLAQLGYKSQLARKWKSLESFAVSFCAMNFIGGTVRRWEGEGASSVLGLTAVTLSARSCTSASWPVVLLRPGERQNPSNFEDCDSRRDATTASGNHRFSSQAQWYTRTNRSHRSTRKGTFPSTTFVLSTLLFLGAFSLPTHNLAGKSDGKGIESQGEERGQNVNVSMCTSIRLSQTTVSQASQDSFRSIIPGLRSGTPRSSSRTDAQRASSLSSFACTRLATVGKPFRAHLGL